MPNLPQNLTPSEELGMDVGTASHRLRKMVLFQLLQRLGEDLCFKCGKQIEIYEQLSIEHKQPWRHVDPALFWDMGNIAFSHLACNKPDRPASEQMKRVGPPGTAWCSKHKEFLPESEFGPGVSRGLGLDSRCRACNAERQRRRSHRTQLAWGKSINTLLRPYSGTRKPEPSKEQLTLITT